MWHSSTLLVAVQLRRTWDTARRGSIIKPLLEEKPGMFVREGDVFADEEDEEMEDGEDAMKG